MYVLYHVADICQALGSDGGSINCLYRGVRTVLRSI